MANALQQAIQLPANALTAWAFFVSKGLSPAQAAGIVGNLIQESGVDPGSVGDGGAGIAGWTPPSQLYNYAGQVGQPANSLTTQLNYLWYELNNNENGALIALKQQSTPSGAAISFQNTFERCLGSNTSNPNIPGGCNQNARVANAQNVYSAATGKAAPPLSSLTAQLASSGNTTLSSNSGSSSQTLCQIGWTWPNVAGLGGGNVCIWQAGWTRAVLGGGLLAAGGILAIVGLSLVIGGAALQGLTKAPGVARASGLIPGVEPK